MRPSDRMVARTNRPSSDILMKSSSTASGPGNRCGGQGPKCARRNQAATSSRKNADLRTTLARVLIGRRFCAAQVPWRKDSAPLPDLHLLRRSFDQRGLGDLSLGPLSRLGAVVASDEHV